MTDSDKPFACNVRGCGQTFTNNDRLVVHRQTHSLSLKIGKKGEDSITDQTPTPTRFLRNCDEEGLFEELGDNVDNPFDRDFKSATSHDEKKPVETVNTPVPVPIASFTHSRDKEVIIDESNEKSASPLVETDISAPSAIQTVVIDGTIPSAAEFLIQASQTSLQAVAVKEETVRSPKVSVVVSRNTGIPKAIPAFIAHPANPVPKAIPAPQVVSGVQLSIPTPAIVVSPTATAKQGSFIKSAKQKLKETIRIHQSQGKDVRRDMGNIITQAMNEAVTTVKRHTVTNSAQGEEEESVDDIKPAKRSRRSQEDLSPDEKREKFLERNRAAATRCREKRKMWIQALEKKAEEMSDLNSQLQNEISCLKHEVAQLKALLLAHRDCPLSLSQQKMNPSLFDQLSDNRAIVIDVSTDQQSAEATATTALTQMAERATMELGTINNGSS